MSYYTRPTYILIAAILAASTATSKIAQITVGSVNSANHITKYTPLETATAQPNPLHVIPATQLQAPTENTITISQPSEDSDTCTEGDELANLVDLTITAETPPPTVTQLGTGNSLTGDLTGSDHLLTVIQTDSKNSADLQIAGIGNQLLITQTGTGNLIDSLSVGCDNTQVIQQLGSRNEVHIQQRGMSNGFNLLQ